MKRKLNSCLVAAFILCFGMKVQAVEASDGEDYITIRVQASDDSGNMQYALDSDEASAFTSSNEFKIPAGTSHTIYVRDAAGNITSQTYTPAPSPSQTQQTEADDGRQEINIDLEIGSGGKTDDSDYEYLTDSPITPAEPGTGTVYDKMNTDGSDTADKVFYTVTTEEGDVFYLVIDQTKEADNVYLLDTVKRKDLLSLATDEGDAASEEKEVNLLDALSSSDDTDTVLENSPSEKGKSSSMNAVIILIIIAAGGGVYYYFKVYRNKKDEMMDAIDAMDMDEFAPGLDEEEEELDLEVDDEEKQQILDDLINGNLDEGIPGTEDDYSGQPDEYNPEEEFVTDIEDGFM